MFDPWIKAYPGDLGTDCPMPQRSALDRVSLPLEPALATELRDLEFIPVLRPKFDD
jgi:hypothetical protein